MNSYGEIKIGTDIYVFLNDGSYYQFPDGGGCGNCVSQVKLVKAEPAAIIIGPGNCENVIKSRGFHATSGWRMKWKTKATNGPFGGAGKVKAVTKSYKRKNGRWKVRGNRIGAGATGTIWDGSCSSSTAIEVPFKGPKWKRKIKSKNKYHGKVKQYEITGEHYHQQVGRFLEPLH